MNAREKDLLKFVGKSVIWKGIVVNNNEAAYETIVSKCVGYALDYGYLIVDAGPTGRGYTAKILDPVSDVVVYPCDRYSYVNINNVKLL